MRRLPALLLCALLSCALLPGQALTEGLPDSSVKILIYEDLACPDCALFRVMLDQQILPKYAGQAAFIHKDFPLAKHPWAHDAAIASRYFYRLDPKLALAYRRDTLANLRDITIGNFEDKLRNFAREHGADPKAAVSALSDKSLAELVDKDYQDGVSRGVAKTPTVSVAGKPFVESFTFEELSKAIDAELAPAR